MKKISKKLSARRLGIICTAAFILSIIPMLVLSHYNYPSADDFAMGVEAYRGFRDTGNVFAAVWEAIYMAWYDYINWMGYFTSTFFMSLPPSVFGETAYRAGVYIILGIITFGMCYFLHTLLEKAFNVNHYISISITMLLLIVTIQCMPQGMARTEAFYWYCSAANYVLMYSQGLIFLGLMISFVCDKGRRKRIYDLVMASIIGFFVGGANYMTSLSIAIICALIILSCVPAVRNFIDRHFDISLNELWGKDHYADNTPSQKLILIPSILMLAGFALSCMAPGNSNRATGLTGMSPIKAILTSLYYTLSYAVSEWTTWAVICFLVILAPFLWYAVKNVRLTFAHPVIAVIFVYGIVSANIVPPMYAEGNIEAGRLIALFWMQYILCLVLLEGYMIGWLQRYMDRRHIYSAPLQKADAQNAKAQDVTFTPALSMLLIVSVAALVWGSALSIHVNPDYYTSTSALEDLVNGHAAEYGKENLARRDILKDASVQDVVFEEYTYKPDLLFFSDITRDKTDWTNEAVRRYYDKSSVVLK